MGREGLSSSLIKNYDPTQMTKCPLNIIAKNIIFIIHMDKCRFFNIVITFHRSILSPIQDRIFETCVKFTIFNVLIDLLYPNKNKLHITSDRFKVTRPSWYFIKNVKRKRKASGFKFFPESGHNKKGTKLQGFEEREYPSTLFVCGNIRGGLKVGFMPK